jgi:flagellin-like hook-associated protein FlgL
LVSGILNEVTSLANTNYQGQYIFAGGKTSTSPFTTSTATSPAVTSYSGDEDVNYLETPNGQKIQLNVPGSQVFLGTGTNSVFGALNSLVADYSSGAVNTTQAVNDTEALNTALNYVSQQRVTIDNSITQVHSTAPGCAGYRPPGAPFRAGAGLPVRWALRASAILSPPKRRWVQSPKWVRRSASPPCLAAR